MSTISKIAINGCAEIAASLNLPVAGRLLEKSVSNQTKTVKYNNNSQIVKSIKKSNAYSEIKKQIVKETPNKVFKDTCYSLSFEKDDTDLYLGLHKTTMCLNGSITDGTGKVNVSISDIYDFKYEKYSNFKGVQKIVPFINNAAWLAQETNVISNYYISITFDDEF